MSDLLDAEKKVAEIVTRMATLGDQIAKGERAASDRFEGLDAKVAEIQRSLTVRDDVAHRRQVEDHFRPTGGSDFSDLIERDAKGVVGVRWGASTQARIVDPITGEEGITDAPGLLDSRPRNEWQASIQRAALAYQLSRHLGARHLQARCLGDFIRLLQQAPAEIQAARRAAHAQGTQSDPRLWSGVTTRASGGMGSASGTGGEWIPEQWAGIYRPWAFDGRELSPYAVRKVTGVVNVPTFSGTPRPRITSTVGSADPAKYVESRIVTSTDPINVPQMSTRVPVNASWLDDVGPAALEEILFMISRGMMWAKVDSFLHGDGAATHQDAIAAWTNGIWDAADSDLGGSTDHRRLFEGVRADAHDNSATVDISGAASFVAALVLGMEQLGPRAMLPLACYTSIAYLVSTVLVDPKLVTVDVFGGEATIKRDPASLASVFHVNLLPTQFLRAEFESTGLYTDGSGAKDILPLVVVPDWELVERSDESSITVDKTTGHIHLVQTERWMGRKREAAGVKSAAIGRNA